MDISSNGKFELKSLTKISLLIYRPKWDMSKNIALISFLIFKPFKNDR